MFPSAIRYRRTAQRWRVGSGRLSEPATGRVVVALCSANRHPDGDWSTAAIALHPGGVVREAALDGVVASRSRFAVIAGTPAGRVSASKDHLAMAIGDAELDLRFTDTRLWPKALGGGGVFSSVPFLNQYWQPYRLGGMASGTVTCGGERWDFTDATLYCERNWGGRISVAVVDDRVATCRLLSPSDAQSVRQDQKRRGERVLGGFYPNLIPLDAFAHRTHSRQ